MFRSVIWVAVLSIGAAAAVAEPARWTELRETVNVRLIANDFQVEQEWRVTGATRAELMAAVPHLTLSGRHGVYGDREMVKADLPEELQNRGDGVDAWAHPVFVPSMLGSRASTRATPTGFHAQMAGGMLGRGESDIELVVEGPRTVRIVEHGTYSLAQLESGHALPDIAFNLGAFTFGRVPLVLAHKTMGRLHNAMFNAAEPLVNWVNDARAAKR